MAAQKERRERQARSLGSGWMSPDNWAPQGSVQFVLLWQRASGGFFNASQKRD
jgi:hypothetical protein